MADASIRNLPDYSRRQGDISDAIKQAVEDGSRNLRVCMPARVTRVRGNQLVDVQPLLKAFYYAKNEATLLPEVCRVPVLQAMGQNYAVILPIDVGDLGLIVCADRSIDTWMAGLGEAVDPIDNRLHALSDAVFMPGLVPEASQTKENGTDLVLRNGQTQIRLERNGMVRLVNDQGHELVDLNMQVLDALNSLTDILAQSQTLTMLGPSPTLWSAAQTQLAQLKARMATIKGYLQTLIGS